MLKRIAVDIDEVQFPFLEKFTDWHNEIHGTHVSLADFTTYEFEGVLGVDTPTVIERVYAFHEVDDTNVLPLSGAKDALAELAGSFRLSSVTARHPKLEESTRRWTARQGLSIDEVYAIGHPLTAEVARTKAEVCREIGAVALIDDSPKHVADCLDAGIDAVLYGDYPWNQDAPSDMTRCRNWVEVIDYITRKHA